MRQSTFQPGPHAPIPLAQRAPRRITITLPYRIQQALLERSEREGRSLSNLAAYLLEHAVHGGLDVTPEPPASGRSPWRL